MDAVPLPAAQVLHQLLLVGTLEVEHRDVGSRGNGPAPQLDLVLAVGDLLPHVLLALQGVAALVHDRELHRLAGADRARVGRLEPRDEPEQGRLARSVRPDDPYDPAWRELEGETVDEHPVSVTLGEILRLDHQISETRTRRDGYLRDVLALLHLLLKQRFVRRDARLALRLTGARGHADPLQLALQGALPGGFRLLLEGQALLLLIEPRGVVSFPGEAVAPVQLEDPAC